MKVEKIRAIMAVYAPGKTVAGMCHECQLTDAEVRKFLLDNKLPFANKAIATKARVMAVYSPDKTIRQIASECGINPATARIYLKGMQVNDGRKTDSFGEGGRAKAREINEARKLNNKSRHRALYLFDKGMIASDIAKKIKRSRERVCQYLRQERSAEMEARKLKHSTRQCAECQAEMPYYPVAKYCSEGCREAVSDRRAAATAEARMLTLTCDGCGKEFKRDRRIQRIHEWSECKHTFCTKGCYWKNYSRAGQRASQSLTSEQAAEVRRKYDPTTRGSQAALARQYGVRPETINKIIHRHTYREVSNGQK